MLKNCKLPAKKMLLFFSVLVFAVLTFYGTVAAGGPSGEIPPQILINGQKITFPDALPFLNDKGRVQAPARFVAQELGASVSWDDRAGVAYINGHGKSIALVPGRNTAEVNGSQVLLDSGAVLEQDRVYVPLRFIAEVLGATVQWDEADWTVRIGMEFPMVRDSGISYIKQEAGWYLIPETFTAWVKAANADKVDFYLTPTGTNQEPVKIATAYSNNQEFSITYTLPGGYTTARFWATAVNARGEESTGILNVYCEPEANPANKTIGFGNLEFIGYNNDMRLTDDGKKAVFSAYNYPPGEEAGMESGLLLLALEAEEVTMLDRGNIIRVLCWDPAGENILYVKDSNLTRLSLKDGSKKTIAKEAYYGSYSPDGSMIAYTSGRGGLWVCDSNGNSPKRLTQSGEDWYPVWYPDGQYLFYFNDLGRELGDGAGHLQGMAKISVTGGSMEQLFPEKTGKFRWAEWIVPGASLHVVSGWDDGYYHHIMDLNSGKITDLGENEFTRDGYVTAVSNTAYSDGGRLVKAAKGGLIEIYDGAGVLQKTFDLEQYGQVYTSASFAPDGRVLLMHYQPGNIESQVEKKIEILDPSTGNTAGVLQEGENYEASFWGKGGREVLILEKTMQGSGYVLAGFRLVLSHN